MAKKRNRNIDWSDRPARKSATLENDPRIEEVEYAGTSGSDSRYLVHLKPGFEFRGYGSRTKSFNSVKDCQQLIEKIEQHG